MPLRRENILILCLGKKDARYLPRATAVATQAEGIVQYSSSKTAFEHNHVNAYTQDCCASGRQQLSFTISIPNTGIKRVFCRVFLAFFFIGGTGDGESKNMLFGIPWLALFVRASSNEVGDCWGKGVRGKKRSSSNATKSSMAAIFRETHR